MIFFQSIQLKQLKDVQTTKDLRGSANDLNHIARKVGLWQLIVRRPVDACQNHLLFLLVIYQSNYLTMSINSFF